MENFIGQYENALSVKQCNKVVNWFEENTHRHSLGKIFIGGDETNRGVDTDSKDSIDVEMHFTEEDFASQIIISSIRNTTPKYIEEHPELDKVVQSWDVCDGYNLQKYLPGGGFKQIHCENNSKDSKRILAWMIYLNTVDDEGGTEFPSHNLTTKAEAGKMVIWPAYWTHIHRGIPSPTETKYIATGWFVFL
jgi:hypothetical protein